MKHTLALLRQWIDTEHGGVQAKAAKQLGISRPYLCDVLAGNRRISEKLFKRLWSCWPDRRNGLNQAWAQDALDRVKMRNGSKKRD